MCHKNWWNNKWWRWRFVFSHGNVQLIEYCSNYSATRGSLWFYSKDEATDFDGDIANDDNFRSFKYKARLLGNTAAQLVPNAANEILKNAITTVPLKYLSNFWGSFEMPFINCKVELKLRWKKLCVFSVAGTDNDNGNNNDNNIIFIINDTKVYVPAVTLSARGNQKLSKLFSKGFERSLYWNEYKRKSDNKNISNEFRLFLQSNFVGVNRLFVLVYTNQDVASKRFKAKRNYLTKGIIDKYDVNINGKNFYNQPIDSDIKRYEEIKKLTTGQGEDYTTECLLDYDYLKKIIKD